VLEGLVKTIEVPARLRADGAIDDVYDVRRRVADVDILEGEQLVRERFVTPRTASRAEGADGKIEVTLKLEPERALGGNIKPGDTVAVLLSFKPFDVEYPGVSKEQRDLLPKKIPNQTYMKLHRVPVTNVQLERKQAAPSSDGEDEDAPALGPAGKILVTLALEPHAAERVVFTAEFGKVWLGGQPDDAPTGPTQITERGNVYR
jgi:pilus assembly protein CpaB